MWPLHPLSNDIVGVAITPEALVCSFITSKHNDVYTLAASQKKVLHHHEMLNTFVGNPTVLAQWIRNFLAAHGLQSASVALAVQSIENDLTPERLMQYKLLTMKVPCQCVAMTTCEHATSYIQEEDVSKVVHNDELTFQEVKMALGLHMMGRKFYG